ncbi:hypothetical protein GOBAR_AA36765 [Gossypium barbadense]|uniref:Uncharacterized protein n=1 Tax=Gossypium barbadense TaxID=3634 RepID=A0A2P5VYM8_GOSBA|nr:hypothetical protein GOBAR_AA36765 [Gossypium barbadense]
MGDETITLQACNSSNISKIEGGCINHSTSTDHVVTSSMQERVSKNTYEPCSNNNKRPIYEERRLQIEELDEWQIQKLRTPDKLKLSQDKLNTSPNQLKVGDKVLLDEADLRIATLEPNEEILLTVLSIFPYGMRSVNSSHHIDHAEERYNVVLTWGLAPASATYDPSRSKASTLSPFLRYLHAILARTLTGRRESTSVITTHDTYFIWSMPSQYRLVQSTKKEDPEDIANDVPPRHEDPPFQPPPPSCPVYAAALYVDISECLTRFEQQCFQRFDNIDTTLQQICQHFHISSPPPPREPSSDEYV